MDPKQQREFVNSVLRELNEQGGTGVRRGGHLIPRRPEESPFGFALRIARGAYEVPTSKTAPIPNEAKVRAISEHNKRVDDARASEIGVSHDVQERETALEDSIESQVSALRRSVEKWENAASHAFGALRSARKQLAFYRRLLNAAEQELTGGADDDYTVSSEIYQEIGTDMEYEESEQSLASDQMGESSHSDDASSRD